MYPSSAGAQDAVTSSPRGQGLAGRCSRARLTAPPPFLRSDVSISPDDATLSSLVPAGRSSAAAVHQGALLPAVGFRGGGSDRWAAPGVCTSASRAPPLRWPVRKTLPLMNCREARGSAPPLSDWRRGEQVVQPTS